MIEIGARSLISIKSSLKGAEGQTIKMTSSTTSPQKERKTRSSPRKTKLANKPKPEKRIMWTQKDTKSMLEALVVMMGEGFNANDTNEWLTDDNEAKIKEYLVSRKVSEVWSTSISKVRKKYMNLKASYSSQRTLDKYRTGGGTASEIPYSEYLDQLVGDNPVSNPVIVIDGGVEETTVSTPDNSDISFPVQLPPEPTNIGNPLQNRKAKSQSPRDKMYGSLAGFMDSFKKQSNVNMVPNAYTTPATNQDYLIRQQQIDLDTMKFLDGKEMHDIAKMKQKLAYLKQAMPEPAVTVEQSRTDVEKPISISDDEELDAIKKVHEMERNELEE